MDKFSPLLIQNHSFVLFCLVHILLVHLQSSETFLDVEDSEFHHHGHVFYFCYGVQKDF